MQSLTAAVLRRLKIIPTWYKAIFRESSVVLATTIKCWNRFKCLVKLFQASLFNRREEYYQCQQLMQWDLKLDWKVLPSSQTTEVYLLPFCRLIEPFLILLLATVPAELKSSSCFAALYSFFSSAFLNGFYCKSNGDSSGAALTSPVVVLFSISLIKNSKHLLISSWMQKRFIIRKRLRIKAFSISHDVETGILVISIPWNDYDL